jgi:hypothetical protein
MLRNLAALLGIFIIFILLNSLFGELLRDEEARFQRRIYGEDFPRAKKLISEQAAAKVPKTYQVVSGEATRYGVIALQDSQLPLYQTDWNLQVGQLITDAKYWDTLEGQQTIERTNLSIDKFQELLLKMEREIGALEQEMKAQPFDQGLAIRLQNLNKLKVLTKILQSKVMTLPAAIRLE